MRLSDAQRFDWVRLIRCEGVGPRTFQSLINRFGSASEAVAALPDLARKAGRLVVGIPSIAEIEREFEAARRMGAVFIVTGEPDYPAALQAIDTAPPVIAVRGNRDALGMPGIAIVGSRNASALGAKFTGVIARAFGDAGYCVVSGLARGIDTAAHRAALTGGTIAVLAGGHDRIYPEHNVPLLDALLERGAAISEMPFGWEPRGRDFPRRNRIVSGLSLGVVVVEAARKSGSLITARFALEQGREVFAVPGSPLDPRAQGVNDLIREGATLCGDANDVLSVLAPLAGNVPGLPAQFEEGDEAPASGSPRYWDELDFLVEGGVAEPNAPLSSHSGYEIEAPGGAVNDVLSGGPAEQAAAVAAVVGRSPTSTDDIIRASGLPARIVQAALLDLELAGKLHRHPGGLVSLSVP